MSVWEEYELWEAALYREAVLRTVVQGDAVECIEYSEEL